MAYWAASSEGISTTMTNHEPFVAGAAETESTRVGVSRRSVLLTAGGVASMAVVPRLTAQSASGSEPAASKAEVRLVVNGTRHKLDLDTRQSLLDVLREDLGLTGTKKGCNQGACGACTILLNGRRVVSCLTLAAMHDGATVETIEGLEKNGELHPLQSAFVEHDGLQCGFCTPGQIMSAVGCIAEGHAGSSEDIRFWMSGNICRCGAYPGIVAAVADAAKRA